MKLSEALTKYIAFGKFKNKASSMSTYYTHIRLLCVHLRNCDIEEIQSHHIIEYMNLMETMGWDKNTFNTKANAWKQFFKYWDDEGLVVLNPKNIPVPQRERKLPRPITNEEIDKLLAALSKHPDNIIRLRNEVAIRMLADCGARINEFLSVRTTDIDFQKRETIIQTEKSRGVKPLRTIFWSKETHKLLLKYIDRREKFLAERQYEDKEHWLWIAAHWHWKAGKQWSDAAVEATLKRLSYEAKLGWTAHPHSFRHRFGQKLALGPAGDGEGGANQSVVKNMMGHVTLAASDIYMVMNQDSMRKVHHRFFDED